MNIGERLKEKDFKEFKFLLFKKFGNNTGGNPVFINTSVKNYKSFLRSNTFYKEEVYVFHCIYNEEYIYKLESNEEKKYFIHKKLENYESLNLFDKKMSWVITLFNKDSI